MRVRGRLPHLRRRRGQDATDDGVSAVLAGVASAAKADVEMLPARSTSPADPAVAAFFDVDNTLIMGASIYHFARGLASRKFFTGRDVASMVWQQVAFRVGGAEDLQGIADVREAALAFVRGKPAADIARFGDEIWEERLAERVWSGTRALAQQHLDAGQRVWLVTATPVELAQVIAHRLDFTGALGTVAEIHDGIYTGRLVGEPLHGPAKAEAIRALAAREGLDLARCTAYSDSINDLPMLTAVGFPVAINPDSELKAYAREHDWPVRDFRNGRKALRIAVPAAGGTGAVIGATVAGVALHRRATAAERRWWQAVTQPATRRRRWTVATAVGAPLRRRWS
ncbi:MAG: HAD-superfamily subfamily hydrolase [Mycobacterium sp.]|nr:HAD-superfamily subfamily hydrolase [Mycobacterium sp.]